MRVAFLDYGVVKKGGSWWNTTGVLWFGIYPRLMALSTSSRLKAGFLYDNLDM